MKLRILFFTTATEHTTFRKTARMLAKEGAYVKIIGFTRNNFPAGSDAVPTEILGTISHGNYFRRFINLFKSISKLREYAKNYDIVHCFALDTLIIANIALAFQKKKIVYQVQDIKRQLIGNSIKPRLYRFIERLLLKNIVQLIVSSEDYHTHYFAKYHNFPSKLTTVIENKLETEPISTLDDSTQNSSLNKHIRLGYFGVMRCVRSWEILKKSIQKSQGVFSLYLRGKPNAMPNLSNEIISEKFISFGGPYRSPDDLKLIYESVDLVWAAYPYGFGKEGNWQMARTIRFYEACAYGRPVLVQKGTPHALIVSELDIGKVIDMKNINMAIDQILSINPEDIKTWEKNLLKIDRRLFIHTDEFKKLYQTLFEAVKTNNN